MPPTQRRPVHLAVLLAVQLTPCHSLLSSPLIYRSSRNFHQPALRSPPPPIASVFASTGAASSSAAAAAAAAAAAIPWGPAAPLELIRPAVMPILAVMALSFLGMVPSGIRWAAQAARGSSSSGSLHRRVFTGCALGWVVSSWIFSGTYAFLASFALMAVIAQNEYYNMARANGCYPTWKLGLIGSTGMYCAACSRNPVLRDALFPLTGVVTIVYLLLRPVKEKSTPPTTMNDVSSTFMGIFYFGYMPSFWIRLRCMGKTTGAELLPALLPASNPLWSSSFVQAMARSTADAFTWGALVQWWTMMAIVSADIAAYFAGKAFGKTPLIKISPKKTWEGLIGGCLASMAVSCTGATLMRWPRPLLSGGLYGLIAAVMALIGDLTVSLLKRSAGMKDTGSLLPGHGGLLDRIDSFLLVSAPCYFFIQFLLRRQIFSF